MRPFFYLIVYGFLGFVIERIINVVVLGYYYDNSVLYLPIQPMYGVGVVLTLYAYKKLKTMSLGHMGLFVIMIVIAILSTMLSEHVSGTLYYQLYGRHLWDYRHTFETCSRPYTCIIPSSLFGILSLLTVVYIHPLIAYYLDRTPRVIVGSVIGVVAIDYVLTYGVNIR